MNTLLYLIFISSVFGGFQIFNVGKFGIQPVYLFMALFLISVVLAFLLGKIKLHVTSKTQVILLVLLIVAASLSLTHILGYGIEGYLIQFFKSYLHFVFLVLFSLSISLVILKPSTWKNVVKCWIILSFFINIFGIYQLFARAFELPLAWIDMTNASLNALTEGNEPYKQLSLQFQNFYRATSIFSEPSSLASFNLYILSFLIYPLFINKFFKLFDNKLIINFAFIIGLVSLFVTFSLTGFVGLIVIIIGYLISVKKLDFVRIGIYALLTIIIIFIADYFVEEYFSISILDLFYQRISSILGFSSQGIVGESFGTRADNFFTSFDTWMKNPIFGVGLGQTKNFSTIGFSDYGVMHSLIETGLVGGLIYVSLLFLIFLKFIYIIRNVKNLNPDLRFLTYTGYFIAIILIYKNFIVGNIFINWECWLFIGMCHSILNIINRSIGWDIKTIQFFKKKPHQSLTGQK